MDRKRLAERVREKARDGKIACVLSFQIAEEFGIPKKEMGKILNEMMIKIDPCQLGC